MSVRAKQARFSNQKSTIINRKSQINPKKAAVQKLDLTFTDSRILGGCNVAKRGTWWLDEGVDPG